MVSKDCATWEQVLKNLKSSGVGEEKREGGGDHIPTFDKAQGIGCSRDN